MNDIEPVDAEVLEDEYPYNHCGLDGRDIHNLRYNKE